MHNKENNKMYANHAYRGKHKKFLVAAAKLPA